VSVDSAMYDHLTADATLATLVGARIYPDAAPQGGALPFIVYFAASTEHDRHLAAGSGLASVSFQIDVYAATSLSRRSISDALFDRLHGYAGAMGTELFDVRSCTLEGPTHTYEPPSDGSEQGTYRGRHAAAIWHAESVPTFA